MIAIPYSPDFTHNRSRNGGAVGLYGFCIICGKEIKNPLKAHYLHVHNGGGDIVSEEEAARLDPAADLGGQPVGSDCWRKHPELHRYARDPYYRTVCLIGEGAGL